MKKIVMFLVMFLVSISFVFAAESLNISSESKDAVSIGGSQSHFRVKEVRQDPFPVSPGESVDLYMNVDNIGTAVLNPKFEFDLKYPFTLNPSSVNVGQGYSSLNTADKLTLKYILDVDKTAKPGDYELEFRTYYDSNKYYPYFFKVSIEDVMTSFDLALQDVTKDGVSLAIANTGKNTANSITVSLEDEDDFILVGPSSYIIGNLNMGDYTLVNLFVIPKENVKIGDKLSLKVNIKYTDSEGNRRISEQVVPVLMSYKVDKGFKDLNDNVYGLEKSSNGGLSFFFYTTVLIIVAWVVVTIYKRRKIRGKK